VLDELERLAALEPLERAAGLGVEGLPVGAEKLAHALGPKLVAD
jgi:hypothetical protein